MWATPRIANSPSSSSRSATMHEPDATLYTLAEQAAPAHTALVMVDLQNDFVHPDGWVAKQQLPGFLGDTGMPAVLERSAALLAAARQAGVLTLFVRMIGDDRYLAGRVRPQYRRNHGYERPTCVAEGTWGAEWYDGLGPSGLDADGEIVIDKHRYSAFIGTRTDG